jgi:hypothetical protein
VGEMLRTMTKPLRHDAKVFLASTCLFLDHFSPAHPASRDVEKLANSRSIEISESWIRRRQSDRRSNRVGTMFRYSMGLSLLKRQCTTVGYGW